MNEISENLETLKKTIRRLSKRWDVNNKNLKIVAVSKQQPLEKIRHALEAGHRHFGENRVQDAYQKWNKEKGFKKDFPETCLHLIGPLQSNKVSDAVALFDVIETIDRPKIARAVAQEKENQNRDISCFIQVNVGEEPQKSGVLPQDLNDLLKVCRDVSLKIDGLMCIPPQEAPAGLYFSFLKTLADKHGLENVSMGMSNDYEKAVPLSPRFVRIGSAIFGQREKN